MSDNVQSCQAVPISRALLIAVLEDRLSDRFTCTLVWHRLGYLATNPGFPWKAGPDTPSEWAQAFPLAPEVIAWRSASVQLTRSIARPYKQLLKQQLHFTGYKISELYPRKTRRATVVNWLLAYLAERGKILPDIGEMPALADPPQSPSQGHPGDPAIN